MPEFVSHSQAGQDRWVYETLVRGQGITHGTFLDIGCAWPIELNNTYALEQLGWRGVLIDWNGACIAECRMLRKKTPSYAADATLIDWHEFAVAPVYARDEELVLRPQFDYLSLDIDDQPDEPSKTVKCLENILAAGLTFRAITVEDDRYRLGDRVLVGIMELLAPSYNIFDLSVAHDGCVYETWWLAK